MVPLRRRTRESAGAQEPAYAAYLPLVATEYAFVDVEGAPVAVMSTEMTALPASTDVVIAQPVPVPPPAGLAAHPVPQPQPAGPAPKA